MVCGSDDVGALTMRILASIQASSQAASYSLRALDQGPCIYAQPAQLQRAGLIPVYILYI